jgi:hypothetical protein
MMEVINGLSAIALRPHHVGANVDILVQLVSQFVIDSLIRWFVGSLVPMK